MNAFEAAAANGREADLQAELEALFQRTKYQRGGHVDRGDLPAGDGGAGAQGLVLRKPSPHPPDPLLNLHTGWGGSGGVGQGLGECATGLPVKCRPGSRSTA